MYRGRAFVTFIQAVDRMGEKGRSSERSLQSNDIVSVCLQLLWKFSALY